MSRHEAPRALSETVPGGALVRLAARLVPNEQRREWMAEWAGELEYAWQVGRGRWELWTRALGALPDALWMRRRYGGDRMLTHDLRYAARTLARRPGFTTIVVLTLALCIGANTAIFSVVNAALLRPLPYADPERLVILWGSHLEGPQTADSHSPASMATYGEWRERATAFESLGAFEAPWDVTLTGSCPQGGAGGCEPERLRIGATSSTLFPTLGVRPVLGRGFRPEEDVPGGPKVAVLAYGLWQRRFAGARDVLGQRVLLDGEPYTVVGVMPRDFRLPGIDDDLGLYAPLPILGSWLDLSRRLPQMLQVIGRLKPGVTLERARAEMASIAQWQAAQFPATAGGRGVVVVPLHDEVTGGSRPALLMLVGAAGFVLLIGCANVANLMLTRATGRQHEMAVRTALGASRRRLVAQLLTEGVALAAVSGALGLVLAWWGVRALVAMSPASLPRLNHIGIDGSVLAFTLVMSLVTSVAFALVPALHAARAAAGERLREGGRGGTAGRSRRGLRRTLVVGEMAIAVVLVVGAGLLINSFARLRHADPGFRPEQVMAMKLTLSRGDYPDRQRRGAFGAAVLERVQRLPGVTAAGAIDRLPLHDDNASTVVLAEGRPPASMAELPQADVRFASTDYFKAMGIPLLAGRSFRGSEQLAGPDSAASFVVIINRTLARTLYPDAAPDVAVGRRVKLGAAGPTDPWWTIIGVVGDVRDVIFRNDPESQLFLANTAFGPETFTLVVRSAAAPEPLAAALRREVAALDRNVPVSDVRTLTQVVRESVTSERFTTTLLTLFSSLALGLAAVGIYGVMAYAVSERRREIGIRVAFGARRADVMRLVVGEGALLVAVAIALGLAGAWAATRLIAKQLYGVTPNDPLTFAGATALLAAVALAACWIPARRAAKVDPMVAMRND